MNYSDMLLKQIRELNDELDQYVEPAGPDEVARREELLEALAWYVNKLQMRVLSGSCAANVSTATPGHWAQGAANRRAQLGQEPKRGGDNRASVAMGF